MRVLLVIAGLVAAAALFVVLRPEDDAGGDLAATATREPGTRTERQTAETESTALPPAQRPRPAKNARQAPAVQTVGIRIANGRPVGGIERASVRRGARVRVVVRSDVRDHVHVHGYDRFGDVGPGAPARIAFRATIAGRFEIELEDRGLPIAELEVRP